MMHAIADVSRRTLENSDCSIGSRCHNTTRFNGTQVGLIGFATIFILFAILACLSDCGTNGRQTKQQQRKRRKYINERVIIKTVLTRKKEVSCHQPSKENSEANTIGERSEGGVGPIFQRQKSNLILSLCDGDGDVDSLDGNSENSELKCPVCCEAYAENDKICWSRNQLCNHAFHVDCIELWLLMHDRCPVCRNEYLVSDDNFEVPTAGDGNTISQLPSPSTDRSPILEEADTLANIIRAVYRINPIVNSNCDWWFSSRPIVSPRPQCDEEGGSRPNVEQSSSSLQSPVARSDVDIETGHKICRRSSSVG